MGFIEWLLLITLSVLWGGSFFFVGIAVAGLPPFTMVVLRVGLAAVALHVIILMMGLSMPTDGKLWTAFLSMGFLNNMIPFGTTILGERLELQHFAGMGLIGLGLVAIDGRPLAVLSHGLAPKLTQVPVLPKRFLDRDA
ncbi:MAG TPA: EamA family transporter [Alphaproteobacteria bacterium]|nr:EamA family transporter [Alphaproteobacteria bacterium]